MFPAATQMLEGQKTSAAPKHSSAPEAKRWCPRMLVAPNPWWDLPFGGNPTLRYLQKNRSSHFPGPLRAPQPHPLPSAPLAAGPERGWAAPYLGLLSAAAVPGSRRMRVGDTVGLVQPHLLFAASPSPAFDRLQVTASQDSLKVLCSHFPLLAPSHWTALIF